MKKLFIATALLLILAGVALAGIGRHKGIWIENGLCIGCGPGIFTSSVTTSEPEAAWTAWGEWAK